VIEDRNDFSCLRRSKYWCFLCIFRGGFSKITSATLFLPCWLLYYASSTSYITVSTTHIFCLYLFYISSNATLGVCRRLSRRISIACVRSVGEVWGDGYHKFTYDFCTKCFELSFYHIRLFHPYTFIIIVKLYIEKALS